MLKEILSISQYPYLQPDDTISNKIATLFKTYGLVFLAILFIAAPAITLTDSLVVHILHFKSIKDQDNISIKQMLQKTGYVAGLIYICLLGPILEETVFRLPLSFKRTHIAISLTIAMFLIVGAFPVAKTLIVSLRISLNLLKLAIPVGTYFAVEKFLPADINLSQSTKKWLIITSICLFGLVHISNYSPLQWPVIWLYPIYVIPQLCMGWLITYVRFKNGFLWGIALHCVINSCSMAIASGYNEPAKTKPVPTVITHPKKVTDTSSKLKSK